MGIWFIFSIQLSLFLKEGIVFPSVQKVSHFPKHSTVYASRLFCPGNLKGKLSLLPQKTQYSKKKENTLKSKRKKLMTCNFINFDWFERLLCEENKEKG